MPKPKGRKPPQHAQDTTCKWCGHTPSHKRADCSAKDVTCYACNKTGHFQNVCSSSAGKPSHPSTVNDITWDASNVFLDVLELAKNSDVSYAVIADDGKHDIKFKLDTGADFTVIPTNLFKQLTPYSLTNTDACLSSATGFALNVRGKFEAMLTWRSKQCSTKIFVAENVRTPLLGRSPIEALGLIHRVEAISTIPVNIRTQYPSLFTGLGCMSEPYEIRIKHDATPYAITSPRRVLLPLLPKIKDELKRLKRFNVIEKVDTLSEWCVPMVVVQKKTGDIRLCVDPKKLNDATRREKLILPAVDQRLAMLPCTAVFSKLDCNSGFFQIPLTSNCTHLTTFITPFGRFCFKRLPFGVTPASEVYQKRMFAILEGLEGVVCLSVFGKD